MQRPPILPLMAILFGLPGCIANVAGAWDGEADCGENGSVDIYAEIENRETYFQGITKAQRWLKVSV